MDRRVEGTNRYPVSPTARCLQRLSTVPLSSLQRRLAFYVCKHKVNPASQCLQWFATTPLNASRRHLVRGETTLALQECLRRTLTDKWVKRT